MIRKGFIVVLFLLVSISAYAQPVQRQIVGPGGCGALEDAAHAAWRTHAVFLSSEGTAWESPRQDVWITAFNPLAVSQSLTVRLFPDGAGLFGTGLVLQQAVTLAPYQRWAVHANAWLLAVGYTGNVNFATMLTFERHGAASMATWANNYATVFYNPLVQSCDVPIFTRPYQESP